jgi:hypothetical protein
VRGETRTTRPYVERIIEQGLVVRADVEHHREGAVRIDPGRGGVHRELPKGDAHPAEAPVTDAQDRLRVGGDDQIDVLCPHACGSQRAFDGRRPFR